MTEFNFNRFKVRTSTFTTCTVSTKRNASFSMTYFGDKIINCKNDFIFVAFPFNNELYSNVLSFFTLSSDFGMKI